MDYYSRVKAEVRFIKLVSIPCWYFIPSLNTHCSGSIFVTCSWSSVRFRYDPGARASKSTGAALPEKNTDGRKK